MMTNPPVLTPEANRLERLMMVDEGRLLHVIDASLETWAANATWVVAERASTPVTMQPSAWGWHCTISGWLPVLLGMTVTPVLPQRRVPALLKAWTNVL